MYTSYYSMSCNPFLKEVDTKNYFASKDYLELISRFNYLKKIKGVGVFIGGPGYGKTFAIRSFIDNINKDLYKVVYLSVTPGLTVFDFFKEICKSLNIEVGNYFKYDMYNNIQKEIKKLVEIYKINNHR